jgi:hypothetical protein
VFIPQVTNGHGEPWWNDIDSGKLLICPPELSGNSTNSHLVANQEDIGEGNVECVRNIAFILVEFFNLSQNLTNIRRLHFSEGRRAANFYRPKSPPLQPGFNPRTLGLMTSTLTITSPRLMLNILAVPSRLGMLFYANST